MKFEEFDIDKLIEQKTEFSITDHLLIQISTQLDDLISEISDLQDEKTASQRQYLWKQNFLLKHQNKELIECIKKDLMEQVLAEMKKGEPQ